MARRPVAFDVVDLCATTLKINEWYAQERALKIRTFQADVHAFEPDRGYDLICAHSFLPWHPVAQRPGLFRRWHDWLRPGGRLCFSNRVSPHSIPFDPAERADRVEKMIASVLAGLRERSVPLPCPEPDFVAMLRKFGERRQETYPELPLDTMKQWIADAGLVLELTVDVADVLPGTHDTTLMSGSAEGRPRMWFQAQRP
jgi:SAM-dependent methyltransferase